MGLLPSQLARRDVDTLAAHIAAVLSAAPDLPISGAWLFGSTLGECRPDSDVDIALAPAPGSTLRIWELQGQGERVLAPWQGYRFDVSALESGLFAFEVVRTGRPVYVRDDEAFWAFVEFVSRRGEELVWRHRRAVAEALASRSRS